MGEEKPCHTCGGTRGVEVCDCRTITVCIALAAGVEIIVHVQPSAETMSPHGYGCQVVPALVLGMQAYVGHEESFVQKGEETRPEVSPEKHVSVGSARCEIPHKHQRHSVADLEGGQL